MVFLNQNLLMPGRFSSAAIVNTVYSGKKKIKNFFGHQYYGKDIVNYMHDQPVTEQASIGLNIMACPPETLYWQAFQDLSASDGTTDHSRDYWHYQMGMTDHHFFFL